VPPAATLCYTSVARHSDCIYLILLSRAERAVRAANLARMRSEISPHGRAMTFPEWAAAIVAGVRVFLPGARALRKAETAYVFVLRGSELRALRRAGREAGIEFPVHPHMLRHATGYELANDGQDTRAIQHYLGAPQHPAHHPLYRTRSRSVQGLLARLILREGANGNFGGLGLHPQMPPSQHECASNPCYDFKNERKKAASHCRFQIDAPTRGARSRRHWG
jgi:hypothetical protein